MKIKLTGAVLVSLLVLFNLFWNLAGQDIEQWDEARYVASAVEMVHSGDFLLNTYQGKPDYWNSKPPLAYWFVAMGYAAGHGSLALVRLQSPLAVAGLSLLVFAWLRRRAGFWPALYAVLLLVSMPLFMDDHGARRADADCVFAFFVYLAFFLLGSGLRLVLPGAYAALGLAFMVKGLEVAPFGLAAWLYTVLLWRRGRVAGHVLFWLPACFLLPTLPWVVARYLRDGLMFFHTMIWIDVVQRMDTGLEGFKSTHWFYVMLFLRAYWPPVVVAALALWRTHDRRALWREPDLQLLLLWFLLPFATFTLSSSRFFWYSYPMLPAFVMLLVLLLARTLGGLPPRSLAVAATLLLGGLLCNEVEVARHISGSAIGYDRMGRAIRAIAERVRPAMAVVYMDQPPLPYGVDMQQRHYATALLLGNVTLKPGGKPAFLASHEANAFLVDTQGRITSHQP